METFDEMRAVTNQKLDKLCLALRAVLLAKDDQLDRKENEILILKAENYQLRRALNRVKRNNFDGVTDGHE